ncbi:unnamed protein product [Brachionus calyciflorus]|uniref:EF-hand domain-containing protein n=1 Tax=Brachionus calyciflorus TaxID=104777 RepID=A0A813MFG8_9BILA|nr:unnamed protein product [Brachionus calyciflorus]
MGTFSSKSEHSQCLKNKLRNLPFEHPTNRDYEFLSYQTALEKEEIKQIIENFLETHPDGRMNRKEYFELFQSLRKEPPEKLQVLLENIFRALGIEDMEADLLTLREFFITFSLNSLGDFKKKVEYAFELYDTNHDNALDVDEARDVVYGIMELFKPPKEKTLNDITKDCIQNMKVTCVVKKGN